MTRGAWKLSVIGLALFLLLLLGATGGAWLAASHYRPLLDRANTDMVMAMQTRDNLEALVDEQGRGLGNLKLAGELRERDAALVIAKAKEDTRPDQAAANKLLRERTGGDPAIAAVSIIDQELGL